MPTQQNHTKTILITGSNGLLGQKLIKLLKDHITFRIVATSVGENRLPVSEGYAYHSMDITNPDEVMHVMGKVKPDIVIHTAAMTDVDQCEMQKENCWKLNVTATETIIKSCESIDCFLLYVSTDFVFDGKAGPYSETDEPNPVSFYGWSKYAAEKAVIHSSLKWAIARTVLVYGIAHDMSRSNIILWVKKSLEAGTAIKVVTDQFRTPTLAEDLARGCALIAEKQATGIFHISGKDFLTPYDMAILTAEYFQLDKSLIQPTDASSFTQPARRPPRTGFDLSKPRALLNYEPHSFLEGIKILSEQIADKNLQHEK